MNEHLTALVHEIFDLNNELDRLLEIESQQALNPPATPPAIDRLEVHLGIKLPPLYRDFLQVCNGWIEFTAEVHMLSIEQQLEGEYADYIQKWKKEQWGYGEPVPVEGIVFGIELNTNRAYLFDTATADSTNEMEVVWWYNEELHRYKNLIEMLEAYRDRLKRLIDRERLKRP